MATIVVTGATGALGSALVQHFLACGDRVVALGPKGALADLAALEEANRGKVLGIGMELTAPEDWTAALERMGKEGFVADGAVLTAGAYRGGAPFHDAGGDAVFRAMFDANLETVHRSLRALLPGMVARKKGSVVLIGSRAVERPWSSGGAAAYAASKAAVHALGQAVAAEVLESGVRVNTILPSTIDTNANRAAMPAADASRWVTPASIARVAAFLLSDDARDISGAALPVYGLA